jgi:hypothetical protein
MKALLVFALAAPLVAQSSFPRHHITVGAGAGLPGGDLAAPFKTSGGITAGYGYRFYRHLQADIGLDSAPGASANFC